jgi:hypothetical protein
LFPAIVPGTSDSRLVFAGGKIVFQSFFMSAIVQPLAMPSSRRPGHNDQGDASAKLPANLADGMKAAAAFRQQLPRIRGKQTSRTYSFINCS